MMTAGGLSIAIVWRIAHWVCSLVVRLAIILMLWLIMLLVIIRGHLVDLSALKVDVHATLVVLGVVLESQLATNLFDTGLDLLHMIGAVVTCILQSGL